MRTIRRILVPLDFSEPSLRALDQAAVLSRALGAELILVTAVSNGDPLALEPNSLAPCVRDFFEGRLRLVVAATPELADRLPKLLVRPGPPGDAILDSADEEMADLIVMGGRGRGGAPEIGRVSHAVLCQAPCPVLVQRGRVPFEPLALRLRNRAVPRPDDDPPPGP
jgi:nucleotide-binding universal stress UspA family protein